MAEYGKDARVRLMRSANTKATHKYGMGGTLKSGSHKPRPITLPTTPWDDEKADDTDASPGAEPKT